MKPSIVLLLVGCGGASVTGDAQQLAEPEVEDTGSPADTDTDTDTGTAAPASCPFEGAYTVTSAGGGSATFTSDGVGCVLDLIRPHPSDCDMFETSVFEPGVVDGTWVGASAGITDCDGEEVWGSYTFAGAGIDWVDQILVVERAGAALTGAVLELELTQP